LFGGYGLALAALALMVFGAIECSPTYAIYVSLSKQMLVANFVGL